MTVRRYVAVALAAGAACVPAVALAGSGGTPAASTRPATEVPASAASDPPPSNGGDATPVTVPTANVPSADVAVAHPVPADPRVPVDTVPPAPNPIEQLRLACEGVRADTDPPGVHRPGIACRWSPSTHRAFAGYRLWRSDGEHREIVFRSGDRHAARHLDLDVEPGGSYLYLIEALNADGRVIGHSRPVRVTLPEPPRHEVLRLECAPTASDAGRGIGCAWSESRHPAAVVVGIRP